MNGLEDDIFKELELDLPEEETVDTAFEIEDDASFQLDEPENEENTLETALDEDTKKVRKRRSKSEDDEDDEVLEDSDLLNLIDSMYEKRDENE